MPYDFENALASLNDQYQIPSDIDCLINAFAEALDYPTQILDSQAEMELV